MIVDIDFSEPDAKKVAGGPPPPGNPGNIQGGRPQGAPIGPGGPGGPIGPGGPGGPGPNMGGPPIAGGLQINEDIKVPDKMVGLSEYNLNVIICI